MKRALPILILLAALLRCAGQVNVTTEIDGTFDSSSYDTAPYKLWGNYFATYFYNMYPQFTNHIYSVSRSGASWENQLENQQEQYCLALWASFKVAGNDWMLANDNSGYVSNDVVEWGTNLFNAPPIFWNGTAFTNEGIATSGITHFSLGGIPDDSADGDSGAISRNFGAMYLASHYGTPVVDMWHLLWTNGLSTDVVGARKFGFYAGGHPYPAGHLCMTLKALIALGAGTNVGALTLNYTGASVSATNQCAAVSPALTGNRFTCTVRFNRMPPAWDVPDGTITNDARAAFAVMPELGNAFRWTIQVTNLPQGIYNVLIDGVLTDTATDVELAAGRNWFTNYNGPLWAQRVAVLAAKRDQEGVDHATLEETHNAGSSGLNGWRDRINYQSSAFGQWQAGVRGSALVAALGSEITSLNNFDVAIHQAAQQTSHTLTVVPVPTLTVATITIGTLHIAQ